MDLVEEAGGQYALAMDEPPLPVVSTATPCDTRCPHGDDIERDGRWGRPKVDGHYRTRVSTLAGTLEDEYVLGQWKTRQVLLGVTQDDLTARTFHDPSTPEGRKGLDAMAQEALERAGGTDAAEAGTSMHELAALYAQDPESVPWEFITDTQAEDLRALTSGLAGLGLAFTPMAEQFVAAEDYAGTFDLGLLDRQGRWWLADLKTGASQRDRRYPSRVAVQLAAYGSAERWCPHHGYLPTPAWHGYLLLSVPLGSGRLYVDRINKRGAQRGLSLARTVRAYRDRKNLARPYGE